MAILRRAAKSLASTFTALTRRCSVYDRRRYAHHSLSFAQEGEDCLLERLLAGKQDGFYVDVGAHHPQRFSNTYRFYLQGWRGINIDPLPGTKKRFDRLRPRDTTIECGIAERSGELLYYQFDEGAFNTFDEALARSRAAQPIATTRVITLPLAQVLRQHGAVGQSIDFLSIDVEGLDLQVLRSNDWSQFRPTYVLAEVLDVADLGSLCHSPVVAFMDTCGYRPIARTLNTVFFRDMRPQAT